MTAKTAKPEQSGGFTPDYSGALAKAEKKFALTVGELGSLNECSISSGLRSVDALLGNGGYTPGAAVISGMEQSCKSSTAAMLMHSAVRLGVPIIQYWDYEGWLDKDYVSGYWNSAIKPDDFGKGKECPVHNYFETVGETFYSTVRLTFFDLPDKRKIDGSWWYLFDNTKNNKSDANIQKYMDQAMSRRLDRIAVPAADGRPQGLIIADSYAAMNSKNRDKEDGDTNDSLAMQARMFSMQIPRIQGFVKPKNIIVLGVNQLRKNLSQYGSPEYEPCGEALKYQSQVRIGQASTSSVPKGFDLSIEGVTYQNFDEVHETSMEDGEDMWDVYRYIRVKTIKNKVGGMPKKTYIYTRVWVSDAHGVARGMDPVFDIWQYYKITGQLQGSMKKFKIQFEGRDSELNGVALEWFDLKALIVGNAERKKEVMAKLKLNKDPQLLKFADSQLKSGWATTRLRELGRPYK